MYRTLKRSFSLLSRGLVVGALVVVGSLAFTSPASADEGTSGPATLLTPTNVSADSPVHCENPTYAETTKNGVVYLDLGTCKSLAQCYEKASHINNLFIASKDTTAAAVCGNKEVPESHGTQLYLISDAPAKPKEEQGAVFFELPEWNGEPCLGW
jgi:hypothetical protein